MVAIEMNRIASIFTIFISAALGAREPPTVNLPGQGTLMGAFKTNFRTQKIIAYLGIPYAQPPIAERRFKPPHVDELPIWEGVRNATMPAASCLQDTTGRRPMRRHDELFMKLLEAQSEDQTERVYDEDCLYLNVYVPEGPPPSDGFAVMVWIHPGDFIRGSPYDINPHQLVFKQKVIVVTVAYRLNIFGFFTTMDGESPGNFGLMDQAGALEWVRNNAESFGGNKDNVCIFGQGSGAVSAGLHLISGEWSVKTFQKVIAMSGNVLSANAVKPANKDVKTINRVADAFGCFRKPTSALISCLRNVNPQIMLDQGEPLTDWGPIIDAGLSNSSKAFIPDYPIKLFQRGQFEQVPILIGYTDMEDALLLNKEDAEDAGITKTEYDTMINDIILSDMAVENNNDSTCFTNHQHIFDTVSFFYDPIPVTTNETVLRKMFLDFYTEKNYGSPTYLLAKYMSQYSPTYAYRFDLKPLSASANEGVPSWVGVPHNYDLVFVLGLPYVFSVNSGPWESSDKRIADIIMRMWTNFAVYSNPTNSGVYINWEAFTPKSPGMLIVDRSFNMSSPGNINFKAFEFWNDYFPKVVDLSTQCCNDSNSGYSLQNSAGMSVWGIIMTSIATTVIHQNLFNNFGYKYMLNS